METLFIGALLGIIATNVWTAAIVPRLSSGPAPRPPRPPRLKK
jgi:hypothetical protein